MTQDLLHVREEQTANTAAGGSSAGVNTRVLNTVVLNGISGASLSANQITLGTGTYEIWALVPCFRGNNHRAYLYNVTDAQIEVLGGVNFSRESTTVDRRHYNKSSVRGRFTITGNKDFEIRHNIANAQAANGLGIEVNDGKIEIYTDVFVWKIVDDFDLLHVRDQKSFGTDGGTSSAATHHTRDLNTVKTNEISGASLSANVITLPAGTYLIDGSAPYQRGDQGRAYLYNKDKAENTVLGIVSYARDTLTQGNRSYLYGQFIINVTTDFEIRHYITVGLATVGLGVSNDDGVNDEVYTDILLRKLI